MSLGFALGTNEKKFVYISDVSRVPNGTLDRLKTWQVCCCESVTRVNKFSIRICC